MITKKNFFLFFFYKKYVCCVSLVRPTHMLRIFLLPTLFVYCPMFHFKNLKKKIFKKLRKVKVV